MNKPVFKAALENMVKTHKSIGVEEPNTEEKAEGLSAQSWSGTCSDQTQAQPPDPTCPAPTSCMAESAEFLLSTHTLICHLPPKSPALSLPCIAKFETKPHLLSVHPAKRVRVQTRQKNNQSGTLPT